MHAVTDGCSVPCEHSNVHKGTAMCMTGLDIASMPAWHFSSGVLALKLAANVVREAQRTTGELCRFDSHCNSDSTPHLFKRFGQLVRTHRLIARSCRSQAYSLRVSLKISVVSAGAVHTESQLAGLLCFAASRGAMKSLSPTWYKYL